MEPIPPEPYDTERAPKRKRTTEAEYRYKKARRAAPKPKSFSEAFWISFLWVFGLPLVVFYLLAFIGSFLK